MHCTDQIGETLVLETTPKRIVSLVPSQSEFLWDLGLREELVGISKFCIHPEEMFKNVKRVGGTKDLNLDEIRGLKPDLIIGNKEENSRLQIELLQKEFKVWMSDIYTLADAYRMMLELGRITDKIAESESLVKKMKQDLSRLQSGFKNQTLAYFIWNRPYMLAGGNTFIGHLINHLGFENVCGATERYPEFKPEQLIKLKPDLCFLSSEPFPFAEKHVRELQESLPDSKILLVDGEMFSWYGSRLLKLPEYLLMLRKKLE